MESAMADLTDPESQQEDSNLDTKMENLIDQVVQRHIDKLLSRLNEAEKDLLDSNKKYETLEMEHKKLHNKHTDLQLQYYQIGELKELFSYFVGDDNEIIKDDIKS